MSVGEDFPGLPPTDDELVFQDGIPGLVGFKGDFHPITTADAVAVKTDEHGEVRVEPIIPNGLAEPSYEVVDELFADDPELRNRLLVMPAIRRAAEHLRKDTI